MLSVRVTNCRDCHQGHKLIESINCELAKMASNLYLNISLMLDRPVEGCKMSTLLHYKRILTYMCMNPEWGECYSIEDLASRISYLTAGCSCCEEQRNYNTISPTTTTSSTTTLTLTEFYFIGDDGCPPFTTIEDFAYHTGSGPLPSDGDIVYTDAEGTQLLPEGFYTGSTEYITDIPMVFFTIDKFGVYTEYEPSCGR